MTFLLRVGFICLLVTTMFLASTAQESQFQDISGKVVYVGDDHNIYTVDLESNSEHQLTDDASDERQYQWPTWSVDGRLAYFCCDPQSARENKVEVYITDDFRSGGEAVFQGGQQTAIYGSWSPASCMEAENCRDFTVLINHLDRRNESMTLERIRSNSEGVNSRTIEAGLPFYYSWNPNGEQIVLHRNNRVLQIFDLIQNDVAFSVQQPIGTFQAPSWSPVDDRILFAAEGEARFTSDLRIVSGGVIDTVVEAIPGLIAFAWSPDGNYIAYRYTTSQEVSELIVLDAITKEVVATSPVDGVLAFFWSPDSTRLAYLTLATPPRPFSTSNGSRFYAAPPTLVQVPDGIQWHILNIETKNDHSYSAFVPNPDMVYLLLYFDQFGQSHRVWSPNSNYIVYTERSDANPESDIVNILYVEQADSVPITLAEGTFAVWSFE